MRTRPGSSWTIWQAFALSRLSPNIFGNLKFLVERQAVTSPGADGADQPPQHMGQFCRRQSQQAGPSAGAPDDSRPAGRRAVPPL